MRAIVRPAGAADIAGVQELTRRFIQETDYREVFTYVPEMVEDLAYKVVTGGVCYVAELADVGLVGMIAGFIMRMPIDGSLWQDEVAWFMDPEHRGGRTAYYLLRSWEAHARQAGVNRLRMLAPGTHPEVGEFYYRRGFTQVETVWIKRL